ncbi:MAG TPA: O-antigen ligase family protein [Mesorhizobium sp.]|jgi:O-antigen ligase|nr:O-antigen ligase family protein [Mesorhizobium sp.]
MSRWRSALEYFLNRSSTAVLIGWGAVLGSVMSVILYGAVIWSLALLVLRRIAWPRRPEPRWIALAFAFYFLAHVLSALVNPWTVDSLQEVAENLPFLGFLPVYARLAALPRDRLAAWLETGVLTGAVASFAAALIDFLLLDTGRAEGLAGNAGPFAVIAASLYGLSLLVALRHPGGRRWMAAAASLCAAAALLLSGMRSLWPILLLAPLLLASLHPPSWRRFGFGFVLGAGALAAVAGAIEVNFGMVQSRLELALADIRAVQESGNYDNSLGYRLRMWDAGLELSAEKPVLGHGPGDFPDRLAERTARDGLPPIRFSHLHNFVLEAVAKMGVVGLAALLLIVALPVWLGKRRRGDAEAAFGYAAFLLVQAAFILSGMVGIMLGHDVLDAYFIYATAAMSALMFPEASEPRPGSSADAAGPRAAHAVNPDPLPASGA